MGFDLSSILNVVRKTPNVVGAMGKTQIGIKLLSSSLAKIGVNVAESDLKLAYDVLDEIKVSEGLDSIVDVLSSDKYADEISHLLSHFSDNHNGDVDHLALGRDAIVVCRNCNYNNRISEVIDDYNSRNKDKKA